MTKSKSPLTVTANRKVKFLVAFSTNRCNVAKAAEAAGVSRQSVYAWRNNDPEFVKAWEAAEQELADKIEAEAYRRAIDGYDQPVYHFGEEVGTIKKYSDRLLMLLLKSHKPEKYKERREISGDASKPIRVTVRAEDLSDDQLATIAAGQVSEYPLLLGDGEDGEDDGAEDGDDEDEEKE